MKKLSSRIIPSSLCALLLAAALPFFAALTSGCSQKSQNGKTAAKIDFDQTRYIVALSRTYDDKALLVCIGADGDVSQTISYKGQAINCIDRIGNDLYLHSERVNRHYILTEQGEWQTFSYDEDSGTYFTLIGENGLIEATNIGFVDGGYESSIIYTEGDMKKVVSLKDYLPMSAVEYAGKIYVSADHYTSEEAQVVFIIDRQTGEYTTVRFTHEYTPFSGKLVLVNDKIVTYGTNADMLHVCEDKTVYRTIGVLDTKTLETKEIDCGSDEILLMYEHLGQIRTVTGSGKLNIYADDLTLVESRELENTDFVDKCRSDDLHLSKMIVKDEKIAFLFINANLDPKDAGIIQEYSKADLQPICTVNILLPECKQWMGELSDFIMLE